MKLVSESEVAAVVAAVFAFQEKKWIPLDLKTRRTFFSRYDLWQYNAVLDDVLCLDCLAHETTARFFGDQLQSTFKYLKIVDENTINANVHPNCRCTLTRITEWTDDVLKWFIDYAGNIK